MSRINALSLVLLVAATPVLTASRVFAQSALPGSTGQARPVILAVTFNGLPGDLGALFLEDRDGHLLAPVSFLNEWNLQPGEPRVNSADGGVLFDLSRLPGLSYSWNHEREELAIQAAPEAFLPTRVDAGAGAGRTLAPYTPGAWLNYDISLTHGGSVSANQALFDIGLFRGQALLTSSFTGGSMGAVRLMSTWQTDRLAALKTLRVGDSYNTTGAWGRGVLYGGIQYGTNFAIRPEFVTVAVPSISGKALLPSTVDVYVNNTLRTRQNVNTGPFTIQNLPVITGAGDVQLVVKDLLGREQLINQSFFVSPILLREGLVEDAYEFGWVRQNYGQASNDYSDPFAAVTYRKGLNSRLTGEVRLEVQKDTASAGMSAAASLPGISSVLESSLALSAARGLAPGSLASVGYSYLGRRWSASARMQFNSLSFRQIGSEPGSLPQRVGSAQFTAPLGEGTLSVNYLQRLNQGEALTRVLNFNYSQRLSERLFASLSLIKSLSSGADTAAGITAALALTMIFDQRHVGASTLNRRPDASTLYTEYQQSTPLAEGTGYRLALLNGGDSERQEASVTRNVSFGTLQAELVRMQGAVSSRLNARGSVAMLDGDVYFSRGLDRAFAIVKTGEVAGVPVFLENQVVAHSNSRGRAVVNNLQPYQENRISIDPLSLQLDMSMKSVEQTVVPRNQGGVLVDFGIRKLYSATLMIVRSDGQALAPWTSVTVDGMEQSFVTGQGGEVSVDLPKAAGNRVVARPYGGPACELLVDLPPGGTTVPLLGPFTCMTAR